jgi:hypothetical protein
MRQVGELAGRVLAWRLARVLGVPGPAARRFAAEARTRLPGRAFTLRAAAFLVATAPGAHLLMPRRARERAIQPLVGQMIATPSLSMAYLDRGPLE